MQSPGARCVRPSRACPRSPELDPDGIGPGSQDQALALSPQPQDDPFVVLHPDSAIALVRQGPSQADLSINVLDVRDPGGLVDVAGCSDL